MKLKEAPPEIQPETRAGKDIILSIGLHLLIFGGIIGSSFFFRKHGNSWGDHTSTDVSIQATMVNSIPLPPRQKPDEQNVLASDTPSPAPIVAKEKTEPPPSPKDIPILVKTPPKTPPPKVAEKPTPQAVPHPQPVKPQPEKATSGETSGVRVAMTSAETKQGTASINVTDGAFGQRYAYYVRQLTQQVAQQWYTQTLDRSAAGHRVYISFRISKDGTPSEVTIAKPSGAPSLDNSAKDALQRIDRFAALPEGYSGSYINVQYYFEPRPQ